MASEIYNQVEQKMAKSIDKLSHELAKLRTGRAHPSLLQDIKVEYYGQMTPLNQVGSIVVEDSRTLTVTLFEKTMVEVTDKAIRSSGLGLNPSTAGQVIRVPLPPLTEERRRALAKQVKGEAENARVAVRNIRRDANNQFKALLKEKTIGEDEERKSQDKIQKITDKFVAKIDKMVQEKETDLMQI